MQSGKCLIPIDLQQWPKSLPSKGSLELDVLQLPLSQLPWIARDGSICVDSKQRTPTAAGLPTASVTSAAQTSMLIQVAKVDDVDDEPGTDDNAPDGGKAEQQADDSASSNDGLSESGDDRVDDGMTGAASSAVQSAPV